MNGARTKVLRKEWRLVCAENKIPITTRTWRRFKKGYLTGIINSQGELVARPRPARIEQRVLSIREVNP